MKVLEARPKQSYYIKGAVISLLTFGIGLLLMWLEYRRWAKLFDDAGVARRDGKRFWWTDLKNVNYVRITGKSGQSYFSHIEVIFNGGKALVFPMALENGHEVMSYLDSLQRKQFPPNRERVM